MAEFYFKSNGKYVVTVENGYLKWTRKGMKNYMVQGSKGEKSVPIKNISAIQLKEPGLTTGYLQIAYSGSSESKGGIFNAVKDENTILFNKKELQQAKELQELVESLQGEMSSASGSQLSEADELKKYKELLDEGVITEEEFQSKKKQLLGL
ncbi:SHOCT domain-containing protein [Sediminibacillus terrae]|uniref:SHOCT domain-containing protein n=1 Tax=Sediminibacillus terrae TaxID=1562106 RepID=UPI001297F386|nr:SHOCT domain-containing protein [Sediminibacillus terrae]